MKRSQLRADFEKSFGQLDNTKAKTAGGSWYYISDLTQCAWIAWVSAFETYSNDTLTGEYDEQHPST